MCAGRTSSLSAARRARRRSLSAWRNHADEEPGGDLRLSPLIASLSLAQHVLIQQPGYRTQPLQIGLSHHDNIDRHGDATQSPAQSYALLASIRHRVIHND